MSASTSPETGTYRVRSLEHGVVLLFGSFQGNAGVTPLTAQIRGGGFSVAWVSTGLYRVTLQFPPNTVLLASTTNNQGLLIEPRVWVTTESITAGAGIPTTTAIARCSRVFPNGTFDIYTYTIAATTTLTDATSADRVNFELGWKSSSATP